MKRIFPDFSLLRRNKSFGILFWGQCISFMGTMMTMVALPYQVYHATHSTALVGSIGLAQLIPLVVCALWGGTIADKYHRKPLLLITGLLSAVLSLLLVLNAQYLSSIPVVFILAAIMSGVVAVDRPSRDAFVQQIVNKEDYPALSSLSAFKNNFCMIVGPSLGGVLLAHFGLVFTYFLDFASFLFSLMTLLMIKGHPNPGAEKKTQFFKSLKEGLQFASSRQTLMGSYFVDFFAMLFGMPMALFPAMALHYFGPASLGYLYAAPAVGGFVFSLFSGTVSHIKRHGFAIAMSAALWGVAIVGFGFCHSLWFALFFLALAGGFDAASGYFRQTLWNETVPNELRGRLGSLEMLSYMSGPRLGDAEAGFVASIWGIPASIISGGVLTIISVVGCCYAWPEFTNYGKKIKETTDAEISSS